MDYYVNPNSGNDANSGAQGSPLKTPQKAIEKVKPGETIFLMSGTYSSSIYFDSKNGTKEAWIKMKAAPGESPVLKGEFWNALQISGCTYIEISGLKFVGPNDKITLATAKAENNKQNGYLNCNGILIKAKDAKTPSHHIIVRNCNVSKFPGGGIGSIESDWITIEDNIVSECAWYTVYGCQGMGYLKPFNTDDNTTDYKMIFRRNTVFRCESYIPWADANPPRITEGYGIYPDSGKLAGNDGEGYKGRTLIANNICYMNGAGAFNVFNSSKVDVFNNTTWNNNQSSAPDVQVGEIFINNSDEVNVRGNICFANTGKKTISVNKGTKVTVDDNMVYNGTGTPPGTNYKFVDPRFKDAKAFNFELDNDSPGITKEAGTQTVQQTVTHTKDVDVVFNEPITVDLSKSDGSVKGSLTFTPNLKKTVTVDFECVEQAATPSGKSVVNYGYQAVL
jgi:hypothetical protein